VGDVEEELAEEPWAGIVALIGEADDAALGAGVVGPAGERPGPALGAVRSTERR
jgi:hypothetical protein